MVNGAAPGPAPVAQARASNSRVTRSLDCGRCPQDVYVAAEVVTTSSASVPARSRPSSTLFEPGQFDGPSPAIEPPVARVLAEVSVLTRGGKLSLDADAERGHERLGEGVLACLVDDVLREVELRHPGHPVRRAPGRAGDVRIERRVLEAGLEHPLQHGKARARCLCRGCAFWRGDRRWTAALVGAGTGDGERRDQRRQRDKAAPQRARGQSIEHAGLTRRAPSRFPAPGTQRQGFCQIGGRAGVASGSR